MTRSASPVLGTSSSGGSLGTGKGTCSCFLCPALLTQGALFQMGAQFLCLGSKSSQSAGAIWLSTCLCAHARVHACVCVCIKMQGEGGLCMCLFAGEPVPHPHLLLQPQRTGCPNSSLHLWGPETTATMSVVCAPGLGGGGAMDAGCGGVPLVCAGLA